MADDFDWTRYKPAAPVDAAPAAASNEFDWSQYKPAPPRIEEAAAAPIPAAPATMAAARGPEIAYASQNKAWKPMLEMPQNPTIAEMPIPGAGDIGLKQSISAKFGPSLTDNPEARARILTQNVPGATSSTDVYGNPMVGYKGQQYYASKPGQFDAQDFTSAVTRGVIGAPVAAAAIPLAELAGGGMLAYGAANALSGGAGSVLEDVLASKAGSGQQVDYGKAATNAGISAVLPVAVQKVAAPIAGRMAEWFASATGKGLLVDASGGITQQGGKFFSEAGINPEMFTPAQLKLIQTDALRSFGSQDVARQSANKALGQEFNVRQTSGQISGNPTQLATEDQMRQGGVNSIAQGIVRGADTEQAAQLSQAQEALRRNITSAASPMDQNAVGQNIGQTFREAKGTAKGISDAAYAKAVDPKALTAAGVPHEISMDTLNGLGQRVRVALSSGERPVIVDKQLTPAAAKALAEVDNLAKGKIPNLAEPGNISMEGDKVVGVNWKGIDQVRKTLRSYADSAASGSADQRAVSQIISNFDKELGTVNPLLNEARAGYSEYRGLFTPQKGNAKGTDVLVRAASNPNEAGPTIYNALFGSTFKKGEAQQLVNNLQQVYANNPEGMTALKEGALQRLFTSPKGESLSAKVAGTNVRQAIEGPQGEIYKSLFTPDEIKSMYRFGSLSENIGAGMQRANPSGTSYPLMNLLKNYAPSGAGAAIGGGVGQLMGHPEWGTLAGAAVGKVVGGVKDVLAAQHAISGAPLQPSYYKTPSFLSTLGLLSR